MADEKITKRIDTTGKLREFLVGIMVGVKNGHVDEGDARNIVKLAGQVNESFYSEIKFTKMQRDAGLTAADFGDTPINKVEK